ncbi:MAG TPA: recombinase family protein [Vicinamibacterales bacterium]|nr:recombinase family protein [Vicinamibacterales bacterium]
MRAAIYVRVSTLDQNVDNQLHDLTEYIQRRSWREPTVYEDRGVSGSKDRRPGLDDLLKAARQRQFDVVVCWRLDRLGRSLRHLLNVLQELEALGVGFISLNEGLDATTPAGRLQLHLLGAFAEFERSRIQERVRRRVGPGPPTRQAARATTSPDYRPGA